MEPQKEHLIQPGEHGQVAVKSLLKDIRKLVMCKGQALRHSNGLQGTAEEVVSGKR